jgi:hypothetical protein
VPLSFHVMIEPLKKHNTIGCCGIDCGLCSRFYTSGDSVCPGCGGIGFKEKHTSCGFVSCCVAKHGCEVCSECSEYPCSRFEAEKNGYDSFVTHRKVFINLDSIKNNGLKPFLSQQALRIKILSEYLAKYDDGRSKSFFCTCCALLPIDRLAEINKYMNGINETTLLKDKNHLLKSKLESAANDLQINLKLNRKN